MAFNSSSGQTTANITGGVTFAKVNATVLGGSQDGAATLDLGTVGAGKVWRILSINATAFSTAAVASTCSVNLNGNVALVLRPVASATIPITSTNSVSWGYDACPQLAAGEKVQLVSVAGCGINASIVYVEESA